MLPLKYEDNTLQIKEENTKRAALFFCTGSYRLFCCRYFGHSAQLRHPVIPLLKECEFRFNFGTPSRQLKILRDWCGI